MICIFLVRESGEFIEGEFWTRFQSSARLLKLATSARLFNLQSSVESSFSVGESFLYGLSYRLHRWFFMILSCLESGNIRRLRSRVVVQISLYVLVCLGPGGLVMTQRPDMDS